MITTASIWIARRLDKCILRTNGCSLQNRGIITVFPLLIQQFNPQCFHLRHEIQSQFWFSVGLSLNISLHLKQCSYVKGIKPCLLWQRITSVTMQEQLISLGCLISVCYPLWTPHRDHPSSLHSVKCLAVFCTVNELNLFFQWKTWDKGLHGWGHRCRPEDTR